MSENLEAVYPWPRPQQQTAGRGTLKVSGKIDVKVGGPMGWLAGAARQVEQVLASRSPRAMRGAGAKVSLAVTGMDGLSPADRVARRAEGYVLTIGPRGIELAGRDAAGVFYGALTLAQLLDRHAGSLPCQTIRDWPYSPVRGVHMYLPGMKEMDFFWRWLDLMGGLRLNTLFLEVGGGFEYLRQPKINQAWEKFCREADTYNPNTDKRRASMRNPLRATQYGPVALQVSRFFPKDSTHTELAGGTWLKRKQIERIVEECRARHIQIVPEVQTMSHCYWLCNAYPEIAERADDPWPDTYCPSHPRTYELLFDAMDEVLEVFQPSILHIGHDELMHIGHCPRCREKSGHDLLAGDITRIHDFLADRGVETLMWGDKLMPMMWGGMPRKEVEKATGRVWSMPATHKAIDRIPKDVIIFDWFWSYGQEAEQKDIDSGYGIAAPLPSDYFEKRGFRKIYGNWVDLEFKDWAHRSDPKWYLGAEVSSWCEVSAYAMGHNRIVSDLFPAAGTLWNGKAMPKPGVCTLQAKWHPAAIDFLSDDRRWIVSPDDSKIVPLDLRPAATALPKPLAGKLATGHKMTTVLGTGSFSLLADKAGKLAKAVVLAKAPAEGALPEGAAASASVPVGMKATRLLLLHGTDMENVYLALTFNSWHRGVSKLINYRIRYGDGKTADFTANYGQHIAEMNGYWPYPFINWVYATAFLSVPAPFGRGDKKFYVQEWVNPRPTVAIESIEISLGPEATEKGFVIVPAISAVM